MTAPIWWAMPPEALSAMLSSGPGPGSMLAAAQAWATLSAEYAAAAAELGALVGDVEAGIWQGPSAERYAAAHQPYLAWLLDNAARSADAAATHETTAAAYSAALAAMPTLVEIAANRVALTALVGTNFLGINTIPIAVTEADYARMWMQAATTMTAYQATSEAAVTALPAGAVAPSVLAAGAESAGSAAAGAPAPQGTDLLKQLDDFLNNFQVELTKVLRQYIDNFAWPVSVDLNPNGFPIEAVPFANGLRALLTDVFPFMNPVLASTLSWATFHTLMVIWPIAQTTAQLAAVGAIVVAGPAAAVMAAAGGAATALGIVGVAVPHSVDVPALAVPAAAPAAPVVAPTSVSPTVPSGTPAGLSSAPAAPASVAAPAGPTPVPPGGGPAVGAGPTGSMYAVGLAQSSAQSRLSSRRSRSLREAAPAEAVGEEAAVATAAAKRARARRRRGGTVRDEGHRYEYLDADTGVSAKSVEPTGMTERSGGAFASGARSPLLPSNWSAETATTESMSPDPESLKLEGN